MCFKLLLALLEDPSNLKTYKDAHEEFYNESKSNLESFKAYLMDYSKGQEYIFEYKVLDNQLIINIYDMEGKFIKRFIN